MTANGTITGRSSVLPDDIDGDGSSGTDGGEGYTAAFTTVDMAIARANTHQERGGGLREGLKRSGSEAYRSTSLTFFDVSYKS